MWNVFWDVQKKIKLKKDVEDFIVDGWTQYKCMRECNILHRIQASTSFSTAHCTFSTVLCSSQFQRNQVSKQCPQTMQLCIWISITLNSVPFTEPLNQSPTIWKEAFIQSRDTWPLSLHYRMFSFNVIYIISVITSVWENVPTETFSDKKQTHAENNYSYQLRRRLEGSNLPLSQQ